MVSEALLWLVYLHGTVTGIAAQLTTH